MIALLAALVMTAGPEPRSSGGALAPASLPAGTNALYGFVGVPEVAVGYRQGFGLLEVEGRASFDVFEASAVAEAAVKLRAFSGAKLRLAPVLALGLELNPGARYFKTSNFGFVGLRPRAAFHASYAITETVSGVAFIDVPWALALTVRGFQLTPTIGAGAEVHVGSGFSLLFAAFGGVELSQAPLAIVEARGAWGVRLGVGYRLF